MSPNRSTLSLVLLLLGVLSAVMVGCKAPNVVSGGSSSETNTSGAHNLRDEEQPSQEVNVSYPAGSFLPGLPSLTVPKGPVPGGATCSQPRQPSVMVNSVPNGGVQVSIKQYGGKVHEEGVTSTASSTATTKPSASGTDLPAGGMNADGSWSFGFKVNDIAAKAKEKGGLLILMGLAGIVLIWPCGKYVQGALVLFLAFAFLTLPDWVYYVGILIGAVLIAVHYRTALVQMVSGQAHAEASGAIDPAKAEEVASYAAEKMDGWVQQLTQRIKDSMKKK